MWLLPDNELELHLQTDQDEQIINWFASKYESMFPELFMFAFNPPIITLAVLNYFPVPEFHTRELTNWDLSNIRLWKNVEKYLSGVSPRVLSIQK
jgi:hypothetical protein